jgi:O-6-methylguanine DNA methyltransferase
MQTHMRRVTFDTPLGRCALSWHDAGLTGFELPEASPRPTDDSAPPAEILQVIERVRLHLSGRFQDFSDLRYDFSNLPAFNLAVLRETLRIRPGATTTYGAIAAALGQSAAASRAVGTALGANRWPLLIPCHRVVAADGRMTGFSGPGGIRTKTRLLALEGAQLLSE